MRMVSIMKDLNVRLHCIDIKWLVKKKSFYAVLFSAKFFSNFLQNH